MFVCGYCMGLDLVDFLAAVYWNKRIGIFAWYSYLILGRCILQY